MLTDYAKAVSSSIEAGTDEIVDLVEVAFERMDAGGEIDVAQLLEQLRLVALGAGYETARTVQERYANGQGPVDARTFDAQTLRDQVTAKRLEALDAAD